MKKFPFEPRVAYFSLEIALEDALPTYAGGLGVLAGDLLRSAADIDFPMVGVTLLNRRGYLRQEISSAGRQLARAERRYPLDKLEKIEQTVEVSIGGTPVRVGAWIYRIKGARTETPVILLDTDLPGNSREHRRLTDRLYDSDKDYRLQQEIILGRGGAKMLAALGVPSGIKYHINEGHGSLAAVELWRSIDGSAAARLKKARSRCIFTVHTPLPGAQDVFSKTFFLKYQPDWPSELTPLFERGKLNMTKLGLHFGGFVNAVSSRHRAVSRRMFPDYVMRAVTNGVNSALWSSPEMAVLFDKHAAGWRIDGQKLKAIADVDQDKIWEAHQAAKRRLLRRIGRSAGRRWREDVLTIGFARRFTSYKRPLLIFQDIARLENLARRLGGLQLVFAGKAHPADKDGQELIKKLYEIMNRQYSGLSVAFLPDYGLVEARLLTSGCDVWLNTPEPPLEASGTSGMKAAHNGVPQLGTNDGWWPEGYRPQRTGWLIRESASGGNNILELLEREIMPLYCSRPGKWRRLMRSTISVNASVFNSGATLRRYIKEAYRIKKDLLY